MAGNALSNLISGVGRAILNFCKGLAGGGGGGSGEEGPSGNPIGIDPTALMTSFFKKSSEIDERFGGPDQKVEKAISGLIKDSMGECLKASVTMAPPISAAMMAAEVAKTLPKLMAGRDMGGLTSDYMLKNPDVLGSKIDNVLSEFNGKDVPALLRSFASQVGTEMQNNLGKDIPMTPAQKSGLDQTHEISQNLDQQFSPQVERSQPAPSAPSGPSI
jgi:hypothetical protein